MSAKDKINIVIVDDDINMRKSLEMSLGKYDEFNIKSFKSAKDALKSIENIKCDLIITDIKMPDIDGIEFLRRLGGKYEAIIITAYAEMNLTIEALRLGIVKDFFIKTELTIDLLVEAIKRARAVKNITSKIPQKPQGAIKMEGKNLEGVKKIALKSAKSDASVLLLGESGVGKEVFAKFIHANSSRANAPFVAINMAALPENLLESELFGYEKGAFTDATTPKQGLFESANNGTIFLDEIGEMPLSLQAKLLRALQEREIMRLGGTKSIKINVRFISATNANISDKIANHAFREDLFYRLQTIPITIPPLRERKDEILSIAESHLQKTATHYNCGKKELSKEAKNALLEYQWHGNIRELLSVVERAVVISEGEKISKDDLFLEHRILKNVAKSLDEMECEFIKEALAQNDGNAEKTAEMLGMDTKVLKSKMARFGL